MRQFPEVSEKGIGRAFGTFGELLQGVLLENDLDFLVSFPIARYSQVTFRPDCSRSSVEVIPEFKTKTREMAERILAFYQLPPGGVLTIDSDLPVGKGLASSSADLVACARAIEEAYQLILTEEDIQRFMMFIEPSDAVMHDGVVSFYHKEVRIREYIGQIPHMTVVSIDEGGIVDTVRFNRRQKPFTREEKAEYEVMLHEMTRAIRELDYVRVGQISTRSAQMNQKLLPKITLEQMQDISEEIGGLGVIVAHSGTCIGVLLSALYDDYEDKLDQAIALISRLGMKVNLYHSWHDALEGKEHIPMKRGVRQYEI